MVSDVLFRYVVVIDAWRWSGTDIIRLSRKRPGVGAAGGEITATAENSTYLLNFAVLFQITCCLSTTSIWADFGCVAASNGYAHLFGMNLAEITLGPKMQLCSEMERSFVWHYLLGLADGERNATEAARKAGYSDPGGDSAAIRVRGYELMHRDRVKAALREVAETEFEGLLLPTVQAARNLIENPKHRDHAGTVKTILSGLGLGETVRLKVEGEVTVNHTDAAIEDLRRLKSLGVPREKLLETFGFSGLSRYEAMLVEADRKRLPPPVDVEFTEVKDAG